MTEKVLIVTALGGFVRSFLDNDIRILQDMGYEVHCAANKNYPGAGNIEEYFETRDVKFYQIDFSSNKPLSRETLKAWKQLNKLINNDNYVLVHCHTPIAGVLTRLACRTKRRFGMKVCYTTHGFYFHNGSSKKSWLIYHTIEKIMSRYSDMIITINNEDYQNAKKMHCKNVKHINGVGVDTYRFINVDINKAKYRQSIGVEEDALMILAIGELSPRKNHQIVIKALGKLQYNNVVFVICGNAMNSEATTETIKELAKENHVKTLLIGLRKDIPEICHCADIGVMPSCREGLGLAGIEMLASGLPIVASNVHGIVDYVKSGFNGYVSYPYDERGFADGIRKLADSDMRNQMKENCIQSALPFDKKISIEQMKNIYIKILK